jgi:hypothetical protein
MKRFKPAWLKLHEQTIILLRERCRSQRKPERIPDSAFRTDNASASFTFAATNPLPARQAGLERALERSAA